MVRYLLLFIKLFLVLFINNILASNDTLTDVKVSPRIYYGTEAKIEEFPYFASINHCGAVILSSRWVLTAAHCVDHPLLRNGILWVGGERLTNSQIYEYDQVIIHPGYMPDAVLMIHDIALLRLKDDLNFSEKVLPIQLPKSTSIVNTQLVFVGRGQDESGASSRVIKKVEYTRLSPEQCLRLILSSSNERIYIYIEMSILKLNMCAKRSIDLPGICYGDSGSPLTDGNTLVGLASFIRSEECENTRLGFFTNVANYLDWINKHTGL